MAGLGREFTVEFANANQNKKTRKWKVRALLLHQGTGGQ